MTTPATEMKDADGNAIPRLRSKKKRIPVYIDNKDGQPELYYLYEMNGSQTERYQNLLNERRAPMPNGVGFGISRVDGFAMLLVGENLFKGDAPDAPKIDGKWFLQDIPGDTVDELSQMAMKLNGLNPPEKEPGKDDSQNSPGQSTSGVESPSPSTPAPSKK